MTMSIILKWGKLLRIAIYETHTYGGERCSSQLKGGDSSYNANYKHRYCPIKWKSAIENLGDRFIINLITLSQNGIKSIKQLAWKRLISSQLFPPQYQRINKFFDY